MLISVSSMKYLWKSLLKHYIYLRHPSLFIFFSVPFYSNWLLKRAQNRRVKIRYVVCFPNNILKQSAPTKSTDVVINISIWYNFHDIQTNTSSHDTIPLSRWLGKVAMPEVGELILELNTEPLLDFREFFLLLLRHCPHTVGPRSVS
jgi:hypothetical protein